MLAGLDRIDRQLLHGLGVNPRVTFRQLADVVDATEHTIARRYRTLVERGVVRVVALPAPSEADQGQLLRLQVHPGYGTQLENALARRDDVSWIRTAGAGTEIACGVRASSTRQRDSLLLDQLPKTGRVTHVTAYEVLHKFATPDHADWEGFPDRLDSRQRKHLRTPEAAATTSVTPTPEDRSLIDALSYDARQSARQLASATGHPESTVRRRLAALISSGAVHLDRDIDPVALGFPVSATLYIDVNPHDLHATGQALARHDVTTFVSAVTGPANLYAAVVAATIHDLYDYVSSTLAEIGGVQRIETSLNVRFVKHARAIRTSQGGTEVRVPRHD